MNQKRKQWIMSQQQYQAFCVYRQGYYSNICIQNELQFFADQKLMKYYVWNMVCFLRTRKYPADRPFKFQKVIYTSVCLFKRYYLINSFLQQQPMQDCICSMYVALKLNQYAESYIRDMALAWKGKEALQAKRGQHRHYNDDGYADKELKILQGIGFRTARTKMIHTLQSLYGKVQDSQIKNISQLLREIRLRLMKVYINPSIIFTQDGSKLALAIFLCSLQKINCIIDFKKTFDEKFCKMMEKNKVQIQQLKSRIEKLETYNEHSIKEQKTQYYRKLTKMHYKKPQYKKSPRFSGRHDSMVFDQ